MTQANGGIRLTFAQFAWGFATLIMVLGSWYDIKERVGAIAIELASSEKRLSILETRTEHGFTVEDAVDLRDEMMSEVKDQLAKARHRPIIQYRDAAPKARPRPWRQPPIYGR